MDDAEGMAFYMQEMHGPWLRVAYDDPLREQLKQTYGCFAGKEQSKWPSTERRNGIPSLVVVGADGKECVFDGFDQVSRQGPGVLQKWAEFAWPA